MEKNVSVTMLRKPDPQNGVSRGLQAECWAACWSMKAIRVFEGVEWKDSISQWFKAVAGLTRKEDGPVSGIASL